jgi:hypothetical protein
VNPVYQNLLDRIAGNQQRIDALQQQVITDTRQAVKLGLEGLFIAHPKLQRFCWTQRIENEYNDSTYEDYTYINPCRIDYSTEHWIFEDGLSLYTGNDPDARTVDQDVINFIGRWDEAILIGMFGDYSAIEATRAGVETHDYDYYGHWI